NEACETGRDKVFYKSPRYLRPIRKPKFFAGKYYPSAYGSLGGIKVNHRLEVLTEDYEIIPGLYAAGVDANAIYGDTYVFILPGNTMGFALNSGRMAGENAADYVASLDQ
ncbi:MAG: FAD-binding protein, partial [Firmicutes bacterium]|nr:FAD-binding protein [Bacillota bacterium]